MSRKSISLSTQKILFLLSGNECAFPGCFEKIYNKENNVVLGEMCHIWAVSPGGPRYNSTISDEQLNSKENIIILCPNHHKIVDTNEKEYTVDALTKIKTEHEAKFEKFTAQLALLNLSEEEIDRETVVELIAVDQLIENINFEEILPEKKKYPVVEDYLNRFLSLARNENQFFSQKSDSLIDLVKKESRIVVLGVAGFGKSIELNHLANHYSENDDLYPIKVRLNLLTDQAIEDLLVNEYPDFKNVPEHRWLIILDALDEVPADFIDIASRNIGFFAQKYQNAKIVVSCRNNFYVTETNGRDGKIDSFTSFVINPLNHPAIHDYLKRKVKSKFADFLQKIEDKRLTELLYSPFFLITLTKYYLSHGRIPHSKKEVFEYLIGERIKADIDKYKNSKTPLKKYKKIVEDEIEKLAISAECLGRNYIEEDELLELVADNKLIDLIEHSFLFNKSSNERWEFEHNNFQEFLAARFLSKQSFEVIKSFVSYSPKYNKIKPTWLNTLSFLFGILEKENPTHQKLLDWIIDIEADVLIRFEKDKIGLDIRERIFHRIYQSYQSKNIIIRSEKFESEDLAMFVSDSKSVLNTLIEDADKSKDRLVILEAIRLFRFFDPSSIEKGRIKDVLLKKMDDSDLSDEVKYYVIRTLCDLKIFEPIILQKITELRRNDSSQYTRAGLYKYLFESKEYNNQLDLLLQEIELMENPVVAKEGIAESREYRLSDETIYLEAIFFELNSDAAIRKILTWAATYENPDFYERSFFKIIKQFIEKATHKATQDNHYYVEVLNLLLSFSRRYFREQKIQFRDYFEKTNSSFQAVKDILVKTEGAADNIKTDYTYAIAVICDKLGINHLLGLIKSNSLPEQTVIQLRNMISWEGKEGLDEQFNLGLLEIDKAKYEIVRIDHDKRMKERQINDLNLLASQDDFYAKTEAIFSYEGELKEALTKEEVNDIRRESFNEEKLGNNIVLELLRENVDYQNHVTLEQMKSIIYKDDRWLWFRLNKYVNFDTNDVNFSFGEREKAFLINWVQDNIKTAQFKGAITLAGERYHYRYKEPYLIYFTTAFDIELDESEYLDFLFVDWPHILPQKPTEGDKKTAFFLGDFIISKVGMEKFKKRIFENLTGKDLITGVRLRHFEYCVKYGFNEATTVIADAIIGSNFSDHEKLEAIDYYLDLGGDYKVFESIISSLDFHSRMHLLEKVTEIDPEFVVNYCISELETIDDEDMQLNYINKIIKIDSTIGVTYIYNWVHKYRKLPDRSYRFKEIADSQLDNLIGIYDFAVKNNLGYDLRNERYDYLEAILVIGSNSESNYTKVLGQLNKWVAGFEKEKFLHYQIQKLEQLYYSKRQQTYTLEEIKAQISTIPVVQERSQLFTFWDKNKITIEIILAIIGVVGLVLTIIQLL